MREIDEDYSHITFFQHPGWVVHIALEYLRKWNQPKPTTLSKISLLSVLDFARTDEGFDAWSNADKGDYEMLRNKVNESKKYSIAF